LKYSNFYAATEHWRFFLPDSLTFQYLRGYETGHTREAAGALRHFQNQRRCRYAPTLLSALRNTEG
jgi:hypothetical protein